MTDTPSDPDATTNVTARALARRALEILKPEELEVFDDLATMYLNDPVEMAKTLAGDGDDPLGMGIETLAWVTPYLVLIAQTVLITIADAGAHDAYSGLLRRLTRIGQRKRKISVHADVVRRLTADQLEAIRRSAMTQASALGLREERAEVLANALVGALVTLASGTRSTD